MEEMSGIDEDVSLLKEVECDAGMENDDTFLKKTGKRNGKTRCFICGDVGHDGKVCHKVTGCLICSKKGHLITNCPNQNDPPQLCLKCGNTGHDMFSCTDNYDSEDLKAIDCYICGNTGHLCCVEVKSEVTTEASCYNCGQLGHVGSECTKPRNPGFISAAAFCKTCKMRGHYRRKCPQKVQPKRMEPRMTKAARRLMRKNPAQVLQAHTNQAQVLKAHTNQAQVLQAHTNQAQVLQAHTNQAQVLKAHTNQPNALWQNQAQALKAHTNQPNALWQNQAQALKPHTNQPNALRPMPPLHMTHQPPTQAPNFQYPQNQYWNLRNSPQIPQMPFSREAWMAAPPPQPPAQSQIFGPHSSFQTRAMPPQTGSRPPNFQFSHTRPHITEMPFSQDGRIMARPHPTVHRQILRPPQFPVVVQSNSRPHPGYGAPVVTPLTGAHIPQPPLNHQTWARHHGQTFQRPP